MQRRMGQDGTGIAIARIERALARIEAAASRPAPAPSHSSGDSEAAEELRRAHQALRSRVQSAISEIDGLLRDGEQG